MLDQQIRRMLADPKARALVDNFAGQWLYLRNLRGHHTGSRLSSPTSTTPCGQAMLREMELFFDSIIRENRSVIDLLTADYTFVNERLARHYGIPNVYGSHFRRVTLTEDERRGLLGKGAILPSPRIAHRTSPVVRGKWILENIVGTPPPPPPPDVPALEGEQARARSRCRCASGSRHHRQNAVCAQCHRVMDPIGFALEPFDAVGACARRRSPARRSTPRVSLPTASTVSGPASLREALVSDPNDLRDDDDREDADLRARPRSRRRGHAGRARHRAGRARSNYRFSSLVAGIVKSAPFQMRRQDETLH